MEGGSSTSVTQRAGSDDCSQDPFDESAIASIESNLNVRRFKASILALISEVRSRLANDIRMLPCVLRHVPKRLTEFSKNQLKNLNGCVKKH